MSDLHYFIVSYNKADNIPTLNLLRHYNIKSNVHIVVGEDDPQLENYLSHTEYEVLVFNKDNYIDMVDSVGTYNKTHKVCTYARVFIDEYAKNHSIQYICFLFDDIKFVQLRYVGEDNKIHSLKEFNLEKLLYAYLELLKSSKSVYLVGPPSSSYYIGINKEKTETLASHYGNMFIYDVNKPIGPYKASVLEDMTIVLYNSMIGHIGLFPFGLQVNCREPQASDDCYAGLTRSEYVQHHIILTCSMSMRYDKVRIPYNKFIPKVISSRYKKGDTYATI